MMMLVKAVTPAQQTGGQAVTALQKGNSVQQIGNTPYNDNSILILLFRRRSGHCLPEGWRSNQCSNDYHDY